MLKPVPVRVKFPGLDEMAAEYVPGPDPRRTYLRAEIAGIWRNIGVMTTADDPSLSVRVRVRSPDGDAWCPMGLIATPDDMFLAACACDFAPNADGQTDPPKPNARAKATSAAQRTKRPARNRAARQISRNAKAQADRVAALTALNNHPELTNVQLAKIVGRPKAFFSRPPEFVAQLKRMRAAATRPLRRAIGTDARTGEIVAAADEE